MSHAAVPRSVPSAPLASWSFSAGAVLRGARGRPGARARGAHARPPPRRRGPALPHRCHPFTRFLESGLGFRLARLTRGRDRSRSRLAPLPRATPAMTHGLSKGALGGRAGSALLYGLAPPLSRYSTPTTAEYGPSLPVSGNRASTVFGIASIFVRSCFVFRLWHHVLKNVRFHPETLEDILS